MFTVTIHGEPEFKMTFNCFGAARIYAADLHRNGSWALITPVK